MFKRDATWFGMLIGLVFPALVFGILFLATSGIDPISRYGRYFSIPHLALLSAALNVIPIRIYFVNFKQEKTGSGVLIAMFILIAAYFLYIRFY